MAQGSLRAALPGRRRGRGGMRQRQPRRGRLGQGPPGRCPAVHEGPRGRRRGGGGGRRQRLGQEGERARQRHRGQPAAGQQRGFGRADEEHAVLAGEAAQHLHRACLRRRVEVDEQIATEHEVIGRRPGQQIGIEQIARPEPHLRRHVGSQLMAVGGLGKIAVAIAQVIAAEGIAPVQRAPREFDHAHADVEGVDLEAFGGHAGVQQGHGDGVRFFAAGTWHAQHAQHAALRGGAIEPLARQRGHGRLRFGIAEEPGLRHDDRFDQLLHLGGRGLHLPQIILLVGDAGHAHSAADRALHGGLADGTAVQAHAPLEQGAEFVDQHHGRASRAAPAASSGNSRARTGAGNRSPTLTACTMPPASLSTAPR